jgi:hypothetical protein
MLLLLVLKSPGLRSTRICLGVLIERFIHASSNTETHGVLLWCVLLALASGINLAK